MSCFESQWGNGKVTKANIKELKDMLVSAFKVDYLRADKSSKINKPSSRMTNFPLLNREGYAEGSVQLNMANGTFSFEIDDNNHSVDRIRENSRVYGKLFDYMRRMPTTGKVYGAEVGYESEYTRENHCGVRLTFYGAWKNKSSKRK